MRPSDVRIWETPRTAGRGRARDAGRPGFVVSPSVAVMVMVVPTVEVDRTVVAVVVMPLVTVAIAVVVVMVPMVVMVMPPAVVMPLRGCRAGDQCEGGGD